MSHVYVRQPDLMVFMSHGSFLLGMASLIGLGTSPIGLFWQQWGWAAWRKRNDLSCFLGAQQFKQRTAPAVRAWKEMESSSARPTHGRNGDGSQFTRGGVRSSRARAAEKGRTAAPPQNRRGVHPAESPHACLTDLGEPAL
eukprot:1142776-Pelagomonas_calceolata.AAC.1